MTDQPLSIVASAAPLDDITTFLGNIPADEYEQRRRIRTCRNAASFKATQAKSADARTFCWMVTEIAFEWIYAPADVEAMKDIVQYLRRLLFMADQIESLEARYG